MKVTVIFLVCIFFQIAFSQDQPVTVLSQRWYEKVHTFISTDDSPFSAAQSGTNAGSTDSSNNQTFIRSKIFKFFLYETVVKNDSNKKVSGISWDYVFFDAQEIEKNRKTFSYLHKIKKNKKISLTGTTFNPPELVLNIKDYENNSAKPTEKVEINCVVFEDGTSWKRKDVDEKVCKDLWILIKKREEVFK